MDVRDWLSGDFLTAERFVEGDVCVILSEPKVSRNENFDRDILECDVELKGETYTYTLNKTTGKALAAAYGHESKSWVGKRIRLSKVRVQVRGQMRDSIMGTPLPDDIVKTEKVNS